MSFTNSQPIISTLGGLAPSPIPRPAEDSNDLPSHAAIIQIILQRLMWMESLSILPMLEAIRTATIQYIYLMTSEFYYSRDILRDALETMNLVVVELASSNGGSPLIYILAREASERIRRIDTLFLPLSELTSEAISVPEPRAMVKMLASISGFVVILFTMTFGILAGVFEVLSAISSEEGFVRPSIAFADLAGSITLAAALFGVISWCQATVKDYANQATLSRIIAKDTRTLSVSAGSFAKWWSALSGDLERLEGAITATGGLLGEAERLLLLSHYQDLLDKMGAYEQVEPSFRKILASQSHD